MDRTAVTLRVGRALRLALAEAGISQPELAAMLDIAQSTVSSWVMGTRRLAVDQVRAIDEALMERMPADPRTGLPGWTPGDLLYRAGVIERLTVERVIAEDGALDDQAKAELCQQYALRVLATAGRRVRHIDTTD